MIDLLLEPLRLEFMQRALLAIILVSLLCGLVGSYVVLRGLAFLGEALRHSLFAGVVVAFLSGGSLFLGGLLAALLTAVLVSLLGRQQRVGENTAIGILYTGAFALGVILLNFAQTGVRDLSNLLLGNILGISYSDLLLTLVSGMLVLVTLLFFQKELLLLSFDPALAAAQGLPIGLFNGLLLLLIALTTTIAYMTVGNLLVAALLLAPPATARLLVDDLQAMIGLGSVLGVVAGISGLYLSFYTNTPSGATIVLVSFGLFLLALLFAPRQGLLAITWRRLRLRRQLAGQKIPR